MTAQQTISYFRGVLNTSPESVRIAPELLTQLLDIAESALAAPQPPPGWLVEHTLVGTTRTTWIRRSKDECPQPWRIEFLREKRTVDQVIERGVEKDVQERERETPKRERWATEKAHYANGGRIEARCPLSTYWALRTWNLAKSPGWLPDWEYRIHPDDLKKTSEDPLRKKFEAWMSARHITALDRNEWGDGYTSDPVQCMWEGYQRAAKEMLA